MKWLTNKKLQNVVPFFIIAAIIFIVFGKALTFEYTGFDDLLLVSKPYAFISDLRNLPKAFEQDVFMTYGSFSSYFRPMMIISLMIDAHFCGEGAFCYHATNVLLHTAFCVTLFIFLTGFFKDQTKAFFLTLIFAVHPSLVSAIGWIPGRNDVLMSLFFLISVIFVRRFFTTKEKQDLFWHILFFNFALYTKESALFLIPLALLYFYLFLSKSQKKEKLLLILPLWIFSLIIWYGLRKIAVGDMPPVNFSDISLNGFAAAVLYIEKILPIGLSVYPTLRDSSLTPGIIILLLLILLSYVKKEKWREILFGLSWIILPILLLILQATIQIQGFKLAEGYLEHRMYLSTAGFLILIGSLVNTNKVSAQKIFMVISIFIVIIFSLLSFRRLEAYRNYLTFWNQAIIDSPHAGGLYASLGYFVQFYENDDAKAEALYKKTIELNPELPYAHTRLGLIYLNRKEFSEAEKEIKKDLALTDKIDYTWLQLGRVYIAQDRLDDAMDAWQKAYELNPDSLSVNINLALANAQLGNNNEAKKYYDRAKELGGFESEDKGFMEKLKFLESY
jgi:protein O-mannosyl-transferase